MDKLLAQLVERLQKAYGERLVSVVLYGSAAAGDHQAKFSDYNILCVLSEITPRELGAGEDIFRWWREQCSPAPLLLTEHEVATSTDCFAIEFLDIQRQHRLLFGKDVITSLKVDRFVLSRAGGARAARQTASLAAEGRRHAFQSRPAAAPAARFGLDLLRALPPRPAAQRRGSRRPQARRDRPRSQEVFGIDPSAFRDAARRSRGQAQAARFRTGGHFVRLPERNFTSHRRCRPTRKIGEFA